MSSENVRRFARLFRGRENAHGRYTPAKGSTKKRVVTLKKPVPEEAWEEHLAGRGPFLGIVPVREDNTCYFGAIDLDDDNADHATLEARVRELKLPLVVCRSKSGGAHLFVFLIDPAPAGLLLDRLRAWSRALELKNPPDSRGRVPSLEVFPKQAKTSDKNLGNWINLPYYNAKKTNRYAVVDGAPASLEEFLDHAEASRTTADMLEAVVTDDDFFKDGPPCLRSLHARGLSEGERNSGLFNVGIFLKLKYPDDWDDRLIEYNEKFVDPPLPDDEVRQIIRSLDTNEYAYKCLDAPIVEHCQKGPCRRQLYGIDAFRKRAQAAAMPQMSGLKKILTDPPRWEIVVNDVAIDLATDDLMSLSRFRKYVFERTNVLVPLMKQGEWDDVLRDMTKDLQIVEVPEDAGSFGQFRLHVFDFLRLRHKSDSRESLMMGKPWAENGKTFFRSQDLIGFLQRRQFRDYYQASHVYDALRSLGAGHSQLHIKGQLVQLWYLPTPTNEQTEEFDRPKQKDEDF